MRQVSELNSLTLPSGIVTRRSYRNVHDDREKKSSSNLTHYKNLFQDGIQRRVIAHLVQWRKPDDPRREYRKWVTCQWTKRPFYTAMCTVIFMSWSNLVSPIEGQMRQVSVNINEPLLAVRHLLFLRSSFACRDHAAFFYTGPMVDGYCFLLPCSNCRVICGWREHPCQCNDGLYFAFCLILSQSPLSDVPRQ